MLAITDVDFLKKNKDGGQFAVNSIISYMANYCKIDIMYLAEGNNKNLKNKYEKFQIVYSEEVTKEEISITSILKIILPYKLKSYLKKYRKPKTIHDYYNKTAIDTFQKLIQENHYDIVFIEFIWLSYFVDFIVDKNIITVIDTHDVIHRRNERYVANNIPIYFHISKEDEIKVLNKFNYVLAIQQEEGKYLENLLDTNVLVTPRPFPTKMILPIQKDKLVVGFIGGSADFNIDAIEWFVKYVWNDFSKIHDEYMLEIYGLVTDYININGKNIIVKGKVDNIEEAYKNIDIFINPIRFGAGLKIKNVEAMSFGIPLVTTSVGKEGLEGYEGTCYLECNSQEEFINALLRLKDVELRLRLGTSGKQFVDTNMNEKACYSKLLEVL